LIRSLLRFVVTLKCGYAALGMKASAHKRRASAGKATDGEIPKTTSVQEIGGSRVIMAPASAQTDVIYARVSAFFQSVPVLPASIA
jgi:hypothetical protein